ncbi:Ig-like domain-containing protein [Dactylosporangium sp. AC04546]|uniref:L,D-transpeptidase n=1 Tax=Dactylosporangium sp. AC04546 TaxID=2862460 RepID=UPI001EE0C142|nr:Ig-like domain-containing protein [Dactylosporangium sp. AC04546]WVK88731.1 Ig-like domain-containing protein [Dactylosporangium sp. AC04546]
MTRLRRGAAMLMVLAVAAQVGLSACDSSKKPTATKVVVPPVGFAVTPGTGNAGVPVSTEIGTQVTNGRITDVALVDAAGRQIAGELRADGTAWVPGSTLQYGTSYTAKVTAVGKDDKPVTHESKFTTMAKPSGAAVTSELILTNGATYGVGMPIVVEFGSDVPPESRAAVQQRLYVKSDPPQPGAWHWFSGKQVMYRPEKYWQPGTKITARKALDGVKIGDRYADEDASATVTIGRKLTIDIDNATKQLSVYVNDALVKTAPVSLGKSSTPTSSGTTVIMSREAYTVFRTPEYTAPVQFAMRLTWGGQYIHAAPWSVGDQGRRNVSHGCTNVSTDNGRWLYENTLVGDPVTTRNTEVGLDAGDGWTVWDMPWEQYKT